MPADDRPVGERGQPADRTDGTTKRPDPAPGATTAPSSSRWKAADTALVVAVLAAVAPIIVAATRGVARGWLPVGDDAYSTVRSYDVLGGVVPLVGSASSASQWAGGTLNHPGPLQFDVAAIPAQLLGPGGSMAFATAAANVVAVVSVAWLARQLAGARAATLVMLLAAGLLWSIGSEILYDPWNPYATLLPFLAFMFAAWAVSAGRSSALPVLVIAGSYAVQTHLSYVLLVPGLAAWAAAGWALALRRAAAKARGGVDGGRGDDLRRHRRWTAAAAGVLLLCWAQPLYQQVTHSPGNLTLLLRAARADAPEGPGPKGALQAVGNVVGIPPFWLPPTWGSPAFELDGTGRPLALLAVVLLTMLVAAAGLAWRAHRSGDLVTATGLVTATLAVVLGFASTAKSTSPFGLVPTYVRWLWPISMFAWATLIIAAARTARRARRAPRTGSWPALGPVLAGLTAAVALLALPTVDHGSGAARWAMPVTREVSRQAMAELRAAGPVLVRLPASPVGFDVGPGLFFELQRNGVDFVVDDASLVPNLGRHRRFDGSNARSTATLVGGEGAVDPPAGARRIAYVPALDERERRALLRLTPQVLGRLAQLGRVPLDQVAVDRLSAIPKVATADVIDRAEAGEASALSQLVRSGLIDDRRFGRVDVRRWADLSWRWTYETTALLLGPAPPA